MRRRREPLFNPAASAWVVWLCWVVDIALTRPDDPAAIGIGYVIGWIIGIAASVIARR